MSKIIFYVKAVIFDMDGVVTNTMPDHYYAWVTILKEEGVPVTHHDIYSREGQQGLQSVKELFAKYKKPFDQKNALRILHRKEEYFKGIVKRRFIVGTRTLLRKLKRDRFRLGLVTGTSRHEVHRILPRNISNLFSVIITGNDVLHGKPHPEPYLKCLKQLKIKPEEALVIENAPFGISSAKRAGVKTVAVETSLSKEYLKDADYIFPSIKIMQGNVIFKKR